MTARLCQAIVVVLAFAACAVPRAQVFEPLPQVERAIVKHTSGDTLAVIVDDSSLRAIQAFINARLDGWTRPSYGVPVPQVDVALRTEVETVYFGGGAGFLSLHRGDQFVSRSATDAETREFARVIGVSAEYFQPRQR